MSAMERLHESINEDIRAEPDYLGNIVKLLQAEVTECRRAFSEGVLTDDERQLRQEQRLACREQNRMRIALESD
jgi:hypothetical protein